MNIKKKEENLKKERKIFDILLLKLKSPYFLIIGMLSLLLILCAFRVFQLSNDVESYKYFLNACRNQMAAMRKDYGEYWNLDYTNTDSDLKEGSEDEKESEIVCTKNVNSLQELQPIEGCEVTDLTLKQFVLDGTPVEVRVVFNNTDYSGDDYYHYLLTMYIDGKEIKDIFLEREEYTGTFIATNSGELMFLEVKEKGKTKFLGIVDIEPGPDGPYSWFEVFNKEGERVFKSDEEVGFTTWVVYDEELGEINDSFVLFQGHLAFPPNCNPEEVEEDKEYFEENYYDTLSSESSTYEIREGQIIFVKKEVETYREYCDL